MAQDNQARYKYGRTPHLPWSEGCTNDDRQLSDTTHFNGMQVVVLEKLDGENTSIYSDGYFHARSLNGNKHASQTKIKQLAAQISSFIPPDVRILGQNMSAFHTISYDSLDSFFYVFGAAKGDTMLSWPDVQALASSMSLKTAPVLYKGIWDKDAVKACIDMPSFGSEQEGYVVRSVDAFDINSFEYSVAKFVTNKFKSKLEEGTDNWRTGQFRWNKIN